MKALLFPFLIILFLFNSCSIDSGNSPIAPVLTAPILSSPSNNSVNVKTALSLNWDVRSGADSYGLQVSTNPTFTSLVFDQRGLTNTSKQIIELKNSTKYYWRVNASNSLSTSEWSEYWDFTTNSEIGIPAIPAQLSPTNNSTNHSIPIDLVWMASNNAFSYTLQVSTKNDFTYSVFNQSGLTNLTQKLTNLNANTLYYWRVNATNSGGTSNWSPTWSFTTYQLTSIEGKIYYAGTSIPIPGVLVKIDDKSFTTGLDGKYILNDLTIGSKNLTASKTGYDPYIKSTILVNGLNTLNIEMTSALYARNLTGKIINTNSSQPIQGITVIVLNDDGTPSKLQTISDISGNYQVPAVPQGLRKIVYSKLNYQTHTAQIFISNSDYLYNVQLANKPGIPAVLAPADNSLKQPYLISLIWSCIDPDGDVISYDIYFGENSTPPLFKSSQSDKEVKLNQLKESTKYFWRIVVKDLKGNQSSSPTWSFTTDDVCSNLTSIFYGGTQYKTVKFGYQCWLKENLNIGLRINGEINQTNNSIIEKHCYNDDESNCTTYGGLYQWAEAVQYKNGATNSISSTPAFSGNVQGICPTGWHIPTIKEFETLGSAVSNNSKALKAMGQGYGSGAGTNASGFSALLAGHSYESIFYGLGYDTYFWNSYEESSSNAYALNLGYKDSGIYFYNANKASGVSVRCIKD